MTKEEFVEYCTKRNKNMVVETFGEDLCNIADGFKETTIFLVNLFAFAFHLVLSPIWIPLSTIRYFRWKNDEKYADKMWDIYLKAHNERILRNE